MENSRNALNARSRSVMTRTNEFDQKQNQKMSKIEKNRANSVLNKLESTPKVQKREKLLMRDSLVSFGRR